MLLFLHFVVAEHHQWLTRNISRTVARRTVSAVEVAVGVTIVAVRKIDNFSEERLVVVVVVVVGIFVERCADCWWSETKESNINHERIGKKTHTIHTHRDTSMRPDNSSAPGR